MMPGCGLLGSMAVTGKQVQTDEGASCGFAAGALAIDSQGAMAT